MSIPVFTGKKEDFHLWWAKYYAYATIKEFEEALEKDPNLPDDPAVLDTDVKVEAAQKKAIKNNKMAIASLIMACGNSGLLEYVDQTYTNTYPRGIAWKVMENFEKKFSPKDKISGVEANSELTRVKF